MLRVWWSREPSPGNFGDILTPHILHHFGIAHRWADQGQCDAISTGSIIRFATDGMDVLGSGAIDTSDRINPGAKFHWVRGPLTGEKVRKSGGVCPEVYGDPALLLPQIFPRTVEPDQELGVFAHYVDFARCKYPFVINPLGDPLTILRSLWRCKRVVSSSLHGIIAAHAYGIPAAWARFSTQLAGDGIKFHDHARSVGLAEMPLSTVEEPDFTLPVRVDNIASVLNAFSERLRSGGGKI